MSLYTLPDDILLGILQYVSSWTNIFHEDFKERLCFLTVFRRLRAIALPKVYSHAYINYFSYESGRIRSYFNKYSKGFAKYIESNADLIALANCTHMVKSAYIKFNDISKTYFELQSSIRALQLCSNTWPSITKLEIYSNYNICSSDLEPRLTQLNRMSKQFSLDLAISMPSVTELTLLNLDYSRAINKFYSQVAGLYADQLVKLTYRYGFNHTGRHKLKVMQYLYLWMNNDNMALPYVNSHTLVDLHIEAMPVNISWAPFLDSKDDTVVEFSCLKKLSLQFTSRKRITYNKKTQHYEQGLALNFPELKSLSITCDAAICPFFQMAKFPNVMEYINIKAPPVLLSQLKEAGMPTAKQVNMCS